MDHKALKCDLLIAGGGPAGVGSAVSAARNGAKVILCQDRPVLGGNASSEVRMHMVGANGFSHGSPMEAEARESGLIEEVRLELCVNNPQRSASMLDLTLYDLCRKEPNLEVLLNTTVVAANVEGGNIRSVRAERQSTEDSGNIFPYPAITSEDACTNYPNPYRQGRCVSRLIPLTVLIMPESWRFEFRNKRHRKGMRMSAAQGTVYRKG